MSALSAVVKATGEWIGLFRFQPYRDDPHALEMGVWLHDKFWHGRYSLEIGRLCVDAAFSLSAVQRLMAVSTPDNRGSFSLMKAVGMAPAGLVLREAENGAALLLQEFGITREQWAQRREGAQPGFDVFQPTSLARSSATQRPRNPHAVTASADQAYRHAMPAWSEAMARQDQVAARA